MQQPSRVFPIPAMASSSLRKDDFGSPARKTSAPGGERCDTQLRKDDFPEAVALIKKISRANTVTPSVGASKATKLASGRPDFQRDRFALKGVKVSFDLSTAPVSEIAEETRGKLEQTAAECIGDAWGQRSKRTYESSLKVGVGGAEVEVEADLLPIDSDSKLMAVFSRLDRKPWGTVSTLKAAIRAWHWSRDLSAVLDGAWTERAQLFWQGLKKRADHSATRAKKPVTQGELEAFQRARTATGTTAGSRDAALAGLCFYGVRRSAEGIAVWRSHLVFSSAGGGRICEVRIPKQKNDALGRGMVCFVPEMAHRGDCCPVRHLQLWCDIWDRLWSAHVHDGPLFFVTGKGGEACPKAVSYDSFRKATAAHFRNAGVGTHSWRKGGAQFYKRIVQLDDDVVQGQGGWLGPDTMRQVYSGLAAEARKEVISIACSRPAVVGTPPSGSGAEQGAQSRSTAGQEPSMDQKVDQVASQTDSRKPQKRSRQKRQL